MTSIIQDVKGKIESAYIEAPFDEAKEALEKAKYKIISLEEMAMLRIQEGKDAYISQYGNCTREGIIYIPKKGKFLTKSSPIMDNAKEATERHRKGMEFYINEEQVKKALENSVQLSEGIINIHVSEFGNEPITAFAFGKYAKEYGKFLKDVGADELPIWTSNLESEPFARQLWFKYLGSWYDLGGGYRDLHDGNRVRGVRVASAKSASKKYLSIPSRQGLSRARLKRFKKLE